MLDVPQVAQRCEATAPRELHLTPRMQSRVRYFRHIAIHAVARDNRAMANPTIRETVLVVEDSETRIGWFKDRLPSALIASNPVDAVRALTSGTPDTVFLDFDLGPGLNSLGVASMLADAPARLCIIHSANEDGARELAKLLPGALILPYASFEIAGNSIQPRKA